MAMSAREPLQMALLCKRLKMSTKETNRLRAWSKAAGVEPGPKMGKVLEALKALWVRSNFTADRDKLLMALKLINR